MLVEGKRLHRTRLVQTDRYVVAVDVPMVIPADDPSELCLEPEAVALLREVHDRAEADDLDWLQSHGKVYSAVDAA